MYIDMSLRAVYPCTSTMCVVGLLSVFYGIHTLSFSIFIEGLFLMWYSFHLTVNAIAWYETP